MAKGVQGDIQFGPVFDIWEINQWILFMLGRVMKYHRAFVDIKYRLALFQNRYVLVLILG